MFKKIKSFVSYAILFILGSCLSVSDFSGNDVDVEPADEVGQLLSDIQQEEVKPVNRNKGFHKTTINFDMDEWNQLNRVSEQYGIPVSRVLRNTVRQTYNLQYLHSALNYFVENDLDIMTGNRFAIKNKSYMRKGHELGNKSFTKLLNYLLNG